jgi:cytochrome P450
MSVRCEQGLDVDRPGGVVGVGGGQVPISQNTLESAVCPTTLNRPSAETVSKFNGEGNERIGWEMLVAHHSNGRVPVEVSLTDIDLGSWDFWALDDEVRDGAFATLRREAPVRFFPQLVRKGEQPGAGHWALTRFDDVQYASRHPEIFSSYPNFTMSNLNPQVAEYTSSMLALDDPRHQRLRSIVGRAFTPKVLARIEESIRDRAQRLVSAMLVNHPDGTGELVSDLAGPLPLQVICDMMGVPERHHQQLFKLTNQVFGFGDPEMAPDMDRYASALRGICDYGQAIADDRRRTPRDDLTTSLVEAEVDGERLTPTEIASFFNLLVGAGIETTRNAVSHGVLALTRYPEQRQRWWNDFDGLSRTAVEEIVRWTSPVVYMRRTLTTDVELRGTKMAAGDKVTMWYASANRDESIFADPWMFDVARDPNPHVGYGAGGVHFCLGANLARREINAAFREVHRQVPDIVVTEEPARLLSAFLHGIKRLPVRWTPPQTSPS